MPTAPRFLQGLIKLDYGLSLGGKDWHIINWILNTNPTPFSSAELTAIGTAAGTAFENIQSKTTSDTEFVNTTVTDFGSDVGGVEVVVAGVAGGVDPPALPIQCAAEISMKIGRRYRGGHPKMFVSGIAEAFQTANRLWTSGFQIGMDAAALAYHTAINDITVVHGATTYATQLVNRSLFTGHAERADILTDDITSLATNPMISSQRRRRGRI